MTSEVVVQKATMADVEQIHALITHFADQDEMLHRPLNDIYEDLRDYFVAKQDGEFIGCVALHLLWIDLAEIRGLAVRPDKQIKGVGAKLVAACLEEARRIGLPRVFALTYKPAFFEKQGFRIADVMEFPRKVWNECYRCPKFPSCNEIAVSIDLAETGADTSVPVVARAGGGA